MTAGANRGAASSVKSAGSAGLATPVAPSSTAVAEVPAHFIGRDLDSLTAAEMDSLTEDQLNTLISMSACY